LSTALLIRLDKIGDLVLTLPADEQSALKNYKCYWVVAKGMGFIAENAHPHREYSELSNQFSWQNLLKFVKIVKDLSPEVSVSFQAPWWINMVLFFMRVPQRVGVLSKIHSYLFFNRGVRQNRSQSVAHELEYNQQLVHEGLKDSSPIVYSTLQLTPPDEVTTPSLPVNYIVVHPGMAGSAKNWPLEKYAELIQTVLPLSPVVITGTAADRPYTQPLEKFLGDASSVFWLNEKLNIQQLLVVLAKAKHVVAPSTGVLHLAASLGTSVTGIYSPVRVQKATRWGPKGQNVTSITPSVDCPAHFTCWGKKCSYFDCMNLVSVEEVYQTVTGK
jgi:heptosyltransferase I